MSLTAPPSRHLPQQSPQLTLKARLARELRHWEEMPLLRFGLLLLSSALLLVIAPLLPLAACALWWWAAHSWEWRDRWTSVQSWAWQGGAVVALIVVFAFLSSAQVWILPQLTTTLQTFWHAHLRGDLSLSPINLDGLFARALLFLPLAPALALLYEQIDPRTFQLQRILTPTDLAEPTPPPPVEPAGAAPPPAARKKAAAPPKAKAVTPPRKRTRKQGAAQQTTIESFLAPDAAQATPASPSDQATQQPVTPPPKAQDTPAPSTGQPPINWDDVAN